MNYHAKAPKGGCLSRGAKSVTLESNDPAQQEWLAKLYTTLVKGSKARRRALWELVDPPKKRAYRAKGVT